MEPGQSSVVRVLLGGAVAVGALACIHHARKRSGAGRTAERPPAVSSQGSSPDRPFCDEGRPDDETPRRDGPALRQHLQKFSLESDGAFGSRTPLSGESPPTQHIEDLEGHHAATPPPAARYKVSRRSTVSGPSTNLAETRSYRLVSHPKTPDEEANLRKSLRTCQLFSQLDDDELGLVVAAMSRVDFVQGNLVTLQGDAIDAETECFMVISQGELSAIKDGTVLRVLRPWQYFNERHLMFVHSSCRLTHRVDTPRAQCFSLSADDYRHIVTRVAVDKSELYEGFLDRVSWLKGLTHREKMQLADSLQPVIYADGDYLIEYDTVGQWLYLIVEGTVDVYGRKEGEVVLVCEFGPGDCVGELEFLNNHRTVADVRARGRVKAARLHRDHFELCMGPIVDVLRRSSMADERFAYYRALTDEAHASNGAARSA
jgi:CRP-like cAMP-binding protein